MLKKITLLTSLLPFYAQAALENNIDFLNFGSQAQFKSFSEDLTGALAQKTLIPAEPLGTVGFDLGVSYSLSSLKNKQMGAVSLQPKDSINTVALHAVKGLPFGIDLGVDLANGINNITTLGGSLSYAILDGGVAMPALNIKGFYNQSYDAKAVDFSSYGAEFGVSKGFANITPFASVGLVNGEVKATSGALNLGAPVSAESTSMMKYAAGVNINLMVMDILVGYNQIGEVPSYSLKAGFRF
ncbi:hypothetical protein [Thiosulfativibrio zosterae]|uniref:Outer membrane protein beta-barrel domain-containing protein n=1 Tax=Thiosulfativibrio zosterae TaxID=2675053 RepID=A0A6F8PJK9_9GAMM|nr:hypothetical protein [Thiosulfativibrio zosterae]BBP42282.1 hypothetical protein THMIRHAT_00280 [Thiosulfativibrio zosterae]